MIENAKVKINKGQLINAQRLIKLSKTYFSIAHKSLAPLLIEAKIVGKEKSLGAAIRRIEVGEDISSFGLYFIDSLNKYSTVFTNQSKSPKNDFITAGTMLKNSMAILQKIQAEDELPASFNISAKSLDPLIKLASGVTDILPNMFGFEGTRTYLILFQDNSILRPTGGLIESYGLLTLDKGVVKNFSIHNVNDADRELKGHVDPPYPIRRYLESKHWYLKDSNFDVDFVKSASKSAFFLSIETGKNADGVIGIDNSFKSVFEDMLSKVKSKKDLPYLSMAKKISDSILQKHLLLAFADSSIQDFFTVNNWSSSLWDNRKEGQNAVNDFIGISEANLGGDKQNIFIKRRVSDSVSVDKEGKILGDLTITYDNMTKAKSYGKDYKNYLRIILQKDSELASVGIDAVSQLIIKPVTDPQIYEAKNFVPPDGLEVEKTEEEGKTIYGFFVNIPSGKSKTIQVKYSLSKRAIVSEPYFSYNLYLFKQPGTNEYPFDLSLSYPSGYKPIDVAKTLMVKNGKVSVSKTLNSDDEIEIRLAKQ